VTLVRADGLSRAYSIASLPPEDPEAAPLLELHVRLLRAGRMGNWLAGPEACGAEVSLRGPAGSCFYVPGSPAQRIVLAGTDTGLAPLWGIARDALRAGHTGPIELWHGVREPSSFYLVDELRALARRHPQLQYRQCALEGAADARVATGRLDDVLLAHGPFTGSRVYLCGDPDLVTTLKRRLFLAGAALRDIHADAFLTAASDSTPPPSPSSARPTSPGAPSTTLE
jgi:NAD(P)H-flavin reductase